MSTDFSNVLQAISDYRQGKMIILVDDESRENEGDLIIAAEKITPEAINFMACHARGLICLPMDETLIDKLGLPMMVTHNRSPYETAFTVSIEARQGVSTGISATDRSTTIKAAIAADVTPDDIISPGHIFPLKAKPNGVLERRGQTEGSVDLARLSGLTAASVICEICNDDGSMARRDALEQFSTTHNISILTIEELCHYRLAHEVHVVEQASAKLPLGSLGEFDIKIFSSAIDKEEHIALIKKPTTDKPLVRIHSECLTGDIFGSSRCDCGEQLDRSLADIAEQGGVLLYMRQEGRGIGLVNKIKAYALQQQQGLDTVDANQHLGLPHDNRDYATSAHILKALGLHEITLLTNNPAKVQGLEKYGIKVTGREGVITKANKDNAFYLHTKKEKLGHLLAETLEMRGKTSC